MVWSAGPRLALAQLAVITVQAVLPLLSIYLTKSIVDEIAAAVGHPAPGLPARVILLVCMAGAAALGQALASTLAVWINDAQQGVVSDHVHRLLQEKSIAVDVAFYEDPQRQDTLHRAQAEAVGRPTQILQDLLRGVRAAVSFAGGAMLVSAFHWAFLVLLLAGAVPLILVRLKYDAVRYRLSLDWTPLERKAWYFERVLVDALFAKEVRLFGLGPYFLGRHRELRDRLRRDQRSVAARRAVAAACAEAVGVAAGFGAFGFMAYRALYGAVTVGDFVMFFQAFQRGQDCLRDLLDAVGGLHEHSLFLSSFHTFLDQQPRITEPSRPQAIAPPIRKGITFSHVGFAYGNDGHRVLDDLNLTVPAGKIVALVGKNGAGKTTLVKLVCRLYDPTEGAICIDGVNLREMSTASLRRMIAAVPQEFVPYCASARENIWFGDVARRLDDSGIEEAACHAGAHRFIQSLERGYDTSLGTAFDNGVDLSFGEWQKLALARAFFRDAAILILDEPTTSLDAHSEHDVLENFRKVASGRTTLVISHRFSVVRFADLICVLEGGRITEQGSHEELIRSGGAYAGMFAEQAAYYR